jgi:alpha-tubulin suppressor-like RCC1 family protein
LWTWGSNQQAQLGTDNYTSRSSPGTTVGGGTNWKQVSVGQQEMFAVKTDGTLWAWGYNGSGQLGTGNVSNRSSPVTTAGGGTNWKQVAAGPFRQCAAIKTDGTLWTWGYNDHGRLGDGTTTNRSSPGTTAGGGTNWKEVGGGVCSMAIKTDGTLWTWGRDQYGALGAGTNTVSRSSPGTTVGGGTNWKSVGKGATTGFYCCAAIKTDGTLWTWGFNNNGALGTGNTTGRSSPGTVVGGATNWKQVSVGFEHMMGAVDNTI